jgi:hypothetical protein
MFENGVLRILRERERERERVKNRATKSRRMRWVGHVACMGGITYAS